MAKAKITAKHRQNLLVKWILLAGGACPFEKIVYFAENNHNFKGCVVVQVTMILYNLKERGVLKRYGNIFEIIA